MSLITIKLLGLLGQSFGRVHEFDISTPAEAFKALAANYPGFIEHLYQSTLAGIGYRVVNGACLCEEELPLPLCCKNPLIVAPIVTGSGGGVGRIIAGVAIIGAAIALGPAGILGISQVSLLLTGSALVASGVSTLLSPTPKTGKNDEKASFLFNGPVNTSAQGNVVPVCYGRLIVGSQLISAGITLSKI